MPCVTWPVARDWRSSTPSGSSKPRGWRQRPKVRSSSFVLLKMGIRGALELSTIRFNSGVAACAPGSLIREARRRAGLSQVELGRGAGVTQSVVSAYESGARQPSLPTLERLVRAAGCELEMTVREPRPRARALDGPLGQKLFRHRRKVRDIRARHGLSNVRVFGSVARGEDTAESDVDLLVDVAPGVGLVGLGRCERDLETLLGVPVDLVPADDLKPAVAASALAEARPL